MIWLPSSACSTTCLTLLESPMMPLARPECRCTKSQMICVLEVIQLVSGRNQSDASTVFRRLEEKFGTNSNPATNFKSKCLRVRIDGKGKPTVLGVKCTHAKIKSNQMKPASRPWLVFDWLVPLVTLQVIDFTRPPTSTWCRQAVQVQFSMRDA